MKRDALNRAFGDTPQIFTERIDDTLRGLKEDVLVKRFTVRTAIVVLLITLFVCGIAYAIVVIQGQEWYYANRFSAYQEHEPVKYQAIMENLQTHVTQEEGQSADGLVRLIVQDYSWVNEEQIFTLSMAARPTDPQVYELHPMMALDTDGLYAGAEPDPEEPESRTEHWLWTPKGFGLPETVMADPDKKLLLVDFDMVGLLIGDTAVELPMASSDAFLGEDGASIGVMEIDLRWLDDDFIRSQYQPQPVHTFTSEEGYAKLGPTFEGFYEWEYPDETLPEETRHAVARLQSRLSELEYYNGYVNGVYDQEVQQCVAAFQKNNGLTTDGIAGPRTQQVLYGDSAIDAFGHSAASTPAPTPVPDAYTAEMERYCREQLERAAKVREAMIESTDENGDLTLRLPYSVVALENDVRGEAVQGSAVFRVRIR